MVKCLKVNLFSHPELKIVYPNILLSDGTTKRVDEMAKTDHYNQWEKDFDLVKEMGIKFLRNSSPTTKLMQVQKNMTGVLQMLLLTV